MSGGKMGGGKMGGKVGGGKLSGGKVLLLNLRFQPRFRCQFDHILMFFTFCTIIFSMLSSKFVQVSGGGKVGKKVKKAGKGSSAKAGLTSKFLDL